MGWTIAVVIGISFLVVAGILGVSEYRWLNRAAITDGRVVELEVQQSSGSRRRTTYRPRVIFTSEDGREHTFTRTYGSNPAGYEVGDIVKVAFDRASHKGRILSFGERFGLAVVLASVGLSAVLMSAAFLIGKEVFFRAYLK